ncbi:hypothetical protein FACS1894219_10700 [Clostridia bacterium]|nr:hypothetical protein FACS1894219_10700 [Clostridia bacterium]
MTEKISITLKRDPRDSVRITEAARGANESALRLMIYVLSASTLENLDPEAISETINGNVAASLEFWEKEDVIGVSADKRGVNMDKVQRELHISADNMERIQKIGKSRRKESSVAIERLAEALESREDFRVLIDKSQRILGYMFNTTELEIMYNLCVVNKADSELIISLCELYAEDGKKLRYIESVALDLAQNGILTFAQYEEHFNEMKLLQEYNEKVARIFALGDTKLTAKETGYVRRWAIEYKFDDTMLEEAKNICLERIKEIKISYINGILSNWFSKGFKSVEDIKNEFKSGELFSTDIPIKTSSFNLEKFFEKAVAKAKSN